MVFEAVARSNGRKPWSCSRGHHSAAGGRPSASSCWAWTGRCRLSTRWTACKPLAPCKRPGDPLTLAQIGRAGVPYRNTLVVGQGPRMAGDRPRLARHGDAGTRSIGSPRGANEKSNAWPTWSARPLRMGATWSARDRSKAAVGCVDAAARRHSPGARTPAVTDAVERRHRVRSSPCRRERPSSPPGRRRQRRRRLDHRQPCMYRGLGAPLSNGGKSVVFGDERWHACTGCRPGYRRLRRLRI